MTQPPYYPPPDSSDQHASAQTCWWHPKRPTGLSCTRCGRPACPDCLREASVGHQCTDCVQVGQREVRAQRTEYRKAGYGTTTVAGARLANRAVVTPVLIVLNVVVYVITAAQGGSIMENQSAPLFEDGVLWPFAITSYDEWWRLLTSGFLHYGLLHLAMNMIALFVLGRDLELLLGKVRFIAVYLVSLLGGAAAVFAFGEVNDGTAGASGAIFGLMGCIAVAVIRLKLNPSAALGVIVLNIVLSVSIPGISLLGHLGGLVIGALAMIAMVYAPAKGRTGWQAGTLVALTAALIGVIVVRNGQILSMLGGPSVGA